MNKLVILKFNGSFSTGFDVNLTIAKDERAIPDIETSGKLPANKELFEKYQSWRISYNDNLNKSRVKIAKDNNSGVIDINIISPELENVFNQWLSSSSFIDIQEECRNNLSSKDEIRFLIRTECYELPQLPWGQWKLIKNYESAEIGIGLLKSRNNEISTQSKGINILAIIGNSQGINTQKDRAFLNSIPDAEVKFLVEPQRQEITDNLWEKSWDILFFAGHSATQFNAGVIAINQNEELKLCELKNGLKKSINKGLQLAIFNSCDGLGLARELQELNIPQVIVMKEPVPDKVAQEFLKYFLHNFAQENLSLYQSVKEARDRLKETLDNKYPCASWLPIIGQNPLTTPIKWSQLKQIKQNSYQKKNKLFITVGSIFITFLVILIRELGALQFLDLGTYDLIMRGKRAFSSESPDERIVVITIDDEDIKKQKEEWGMNLEKTLPTGEQVEISLADSALAQLLQKINPYQPRVIGLDIKRDFTSTDIYLQNQLANNKDLFVICAGKAYKDEQGVAPPPELKNSRNRIGFSDIAEDRDNKIRRYFWYGRFRQDSPCLPHKPNSQMKYDAPSFSFLIAKHYLENIGKPIKFNPVKLQEGILEVKKEGAYLKPWRSSDGGFYRQGFSIQEAQAGFQVPLNYRATKDNNSVANRTYSLRQVLDKNFDVFERNPEFIKDKIVLIGVTAISRKDNFLTPFSKNNSNEEKTWGVYIHAHMISQVVSAVEDSRSFLLVWSRWQECIWIFVYGSMGVILIWRCKSLKTLIAGTIFATIFLLIIHIFLFINGLWTPIIPALVVVVPPLGILFSKGKGGFQNSATKLNKRT